MISKIFSIVVILNIVHGVPLEAPSDNFKQFFSGRLFGGEDAPQGHAPYTAALVNGGMVSIIACGGSIVQPNLILTAARCIALFEESGGLKFFHAVVGATNWRTQGSTVRFVDSHIHPDFDPFLVQNDIGFLVLERRLVLSDTVKVISLNFDLVGANEECQVTGWGQYSWRWYKFHMQVLNVTTIDSQKCAKEVEQVPIWWGEEPPVNPELEICTYGAFGEGLCYGDAGNPLVLKRTETLIGVASQAVPCGLGVPDRYTRISPHKAFILDTMAKHQ